MNTMTIEEASRRKILILDGAMGTMIQRHSLQESDFRPAALNDHPIDLKGNNDLLSLSQPAIISQIHRDYLAAGADIIETNTFNSTSISQADYQLESWVYEINFASAKLAREAANQFSTPSWPRFVAGSIGPTSKTASMSPDVNSPGFRAVSFDGLVAAYEEQTRALIDGGVDVLLVETVFDTLNAKAALFAVQNEMDRRGKQLPIMVSGTITDASGRTLSGQTPRAFYISIAHVPLFSVGFNCALGADQLLPHIDVLAVHANCRVSAHPNAGLPNAMGGYDQDPDEFAEQMKAYFERGMLDVVGGCCGTTPDHIKALSELAAQYTCRQGALNETLAE